MAEVFDAENLSSRDKFILLAMADHADHDGTGIYPGNTELSRKTGYSKRTIKNAQDSLKDKGIIELVSSEDPESQKAREWRINPGELDSPGGVNEVQDPGERDSSPPGERGSTQPSVNNHKDSRNKNTAPTRDEITPIVELWLDHLEEHYPNRQRYENGHHIYEQYCKAVKDVIVDGPTHGSPIDKSELENLINWCFSDSDFWRKNLKKPRQLVKNAQEAREDMHDSEEDSDNSANLNDGHYR